MNKKDNISPEFVDLQVNGYKGVDFSSFELTEESFALACRQILQKTSIFLPTIITSPIELYERNLKIISQVIASDEFCSRIPGIHLEGPFLSSKPGAIGAHNPNWVHKPDRLLLDKLREYSQDKIKLLTIAAGIEGDEDLTKYAVEIGVTVSLGHQQASIDRLKRLAQAGASMLTHLGNAMPNKVHRHNNALMYGLAVDELSTMIVTDGHHLPEHIIKIILKVKGADKVIVTSDASPIAGLPAGQYNVLGNTAVLEKDGLLHNPQQNHLVGSSATIYECARYLESLNLLAEIEFTKVTRDNALKAIGLK